MFYNAHDVSLGFEIELKRRVNDPQPNIGTRYRKLFVT